jgi:hypothetical protein
MPSIRSHLALLAATSLIAALTLLPAQGHAYRVPEGDPDTPSTQGDPDQPGSGRGDPDEPMGRNGVSTRVQVPIVVMLPWGTSTILVRPFQSR